MKFLNYKYTEIKFGLLKWYFIMENNIVYIAIYPIIYKIIYKTIYRKPIDQLTFNKIDDI